MRRPPCYSEAQPWCVILEPKDAATRRPEKRGHGLAARWPRPSFTTCVMRYAITWLLLVTMLAIGIGSLNWPTYRRVAERGVSGQATVIELLPKNHNTVRYEYQVAGRTFKGQGSS